MNAERKIGLPVVDTQRIVEGVPDYTEFMTGAELFDSTRRLVKDNWKMVQDGRLEWRILGQSAEGRHIDMLRVGKGKKKLMWLGTPHPNEPTGTLAIDYMSRYLCENPDILEAMDATFIFIKNSDPDGLERNKSWLKGDMDPLSHALGYYRPPFEEQPAWAFPIDHKTLHFHNTPPEAEAVMKAIDEYQPDFLYELHNSGLRGAHYYTAPRIDELYEPLRQIITNAGLPALNGAPEVLYVKKWADGIYEDATVTAKYDYLEENFTGDPALRIVSGATPSEYLGRMKPKSIRLSPEFSLFNADAIEDNSPSGKTQEKVILDGVTWQRAIHEFMEKQLVRLSAKASLLDARLLRASNKRIPMMKSLLEIVEKDARKPENQREATKAYAYNAVQALAFYEALHLGPVYRLAIQAGEIGQALEIRDYIQGVIDEINQVSKIKTNSLQTLVRAQVAAGLEVMKHIH